MLARRLSCWMAMATLLILANGCRNAPQVRRSDELTRFHSEMARRLQEPGFRPGEPLTMEQCVEVALANSLDLRVRELALRLQDDRVKLALESGLPKASLVYNDQHRSNEAAVQLDGMPGGNGSTPGSDTTISFEDRRQKQLAIQGIAPVLDFGLTYYSYQIAVDERSQERLLLERSRQTLRRDVRVAYANYAGAIRQAKLADTAYQAAQQVLRVAKSLEGAELAVHADTALVESAVAQAALELSLGKQRVAESHLILSQLMSLPPGVEFSIIADPPPLPPPPTAELVAAYEQSALLARPELAVQDLARHISANAIRREFANFFPHLNLVGSFNWSSASTAVNPAFFLYGFQVTHSLLNGGADIWRYELAKHAATVEDVRTLLVSLGVLYEVDLLALRVQQAYETIQAAQSLESSRRLALDRIISLYKEGLEDEAGAARALADLTSQSTVLDRAITDYFIAWYALEAAALPAAQVATHPATQPTTQPASRPAVQG